jgi:hypothetical protein
MLVHSCCLLRCKSLVTVDISRLPMMEAVSIRSPSSVIITNCPRLKTMDLIMPLNLRKLVLDVTNLNAEDLQLIVRTSSLLECLELQDSGEVYDMDAAGNSVIIPRNVHRIKLTFDVFKLICVSCPHLTSIHIQTVDDVAGHPDLAAFLGHGSLRHIVWDGIDAPPLMPSHPSHEHLLNGRGYFQCLKTLKFSGNLPDEYGVQHWVEKCPNIELVEFVFPGNRMVGGGHVQIGSDFQNASNLTHQYTTRFRTILSSVDLMGNMDCMSLRVKECRILLHEDVYKENLWLPNTSPCVSPQIDMDEKIGVKHSFKQAGFWVHTACPLPPLCPRGWPQQYASALRISGLLCGLQGT